MAEDRNILREHVYDGIQEYDNGLPRWWLGIFYASIAFSVVFTPWITFGGWSQAGQYEEEVAEADAAWPGGEGVASPAAAGPTPEMAAAGGAIYATHCASCHGAQAEGGIGPNLKDAEWIHGGGFAEILKTVVDGVPEKGMLTWGPVLGPEKCAQVAAYVHGLGGGT
ncbi:c-type cytochrome [Myxococcota bacterium]|nr:c-type cytochrome [Myxococcota bacterium]